MRCSRGRIVCMRLLILSMAFFMHGNVELTKLASRRILELDSQNSEYYVLFSNIHAEAGVWAIPEKAVMLGGVEPLERSLSRKGSSTGKSAQEEPHVCKGSVQQKWKQ